MLEKKRRIIIAILLLLLLVLAAVSVYVGYTIRKRQDLGVAAPGSQEEKYGEQWTRDACVAAGGKVLDFESVSAGRRMAPNEFAAGYNGIIFNHYSHETGKSYASFPPYIGSTGSQSGTGLATEFRMNSGIAGREGFEGPGNTPYNYCAGTGNIDWNASYRSDNPAPASASLVGQHFIRGNGFLADQFDDLAIWMDFPTAIKGFGGYIIDADGDEWYLIEYLHDDGTISYDQIGDRDYFSSCSEKTTYDNASDGSVKGFELNVRGTTSTKPIKSVRVTPFRHGTSPGGNYVRPADGANSIPSLYTGQNVGWGLDHLCIIPASTATPPYCGDGQKNGTEVCDPTAAAPGNACAAFGGVNQVCNNACTCEGVCPVTSTNPVVVYTTAGQWQTTPNSGQEVFFAQTQLQNELNQGTKTFPFDIDMYCNLGYNKFNGYSLLVTRPDNTTQLLSTPQGFVPNDPIAGWPIFRVTVTGPGTWKFKCDLPTQYNTCTEPEQSIALTAPVVCPANTDIEYGAAASGQSITTYTGDPDAFRTTVLSLASSPSTPNGIVLINGRCANTPSGAITTWCYKRPNDTDFTCGSSTFFSSTSATNGIGNWQFQCKYLDRQNCAPTETVNLSPQVTTQCYKCTDALTDANTCTAAQTVNGTDCSTLGAGYVPTTQTCQSGAPGGSCAVQTGCPLPGFRTEYSYDGVTWSIASSHPPIPTQTLTMPASKTVQFRCTNGGTVFDSTGKITVSGVQYQGQLTVQRPMINTPFYYYYEGGMTSGGVANNQPLSSAAVSYVGINDSPTTAITGLCQLHNITNGTPVASAITECTTGVNLQFTQTTQCYKCTDILTDANTCTAAQTVNGTDCSTLGAGYVPTTQTCQSGAPGGTCAVQEPTKNCYACTAATTDGNTCSVSTTVPQSQTCPSGTSESSTGCAAVAPGGVCPVDLWCGDGVCQSGEACERTAPGATTYRVCTAIGAAPTGAFVVTCRNLTTTAPNNNANKCTACGDGITDSAAGEQCDDGNLANGDGCSNTCQTEITQCGQPCTTQGATCATGHTCTAGVCTLNTCLTNGSLDNTKCSDACTALPQNRTCGQTCGAGIGNCQSGANLTCSGGTCKLSTCVSSPTTCNASQCAVVACGVACTTNNDCPQDGLHQCSGGTCKLSACVSAPASCTVNGCTLANPPTITKTGVVASRDTIQAVVNYTVVFTAVGRSYDDAIIEDTLDPLVQSGWVSAISGGGTIVPASNPVKIRWINQNVPQSSSQNYTYTITVPAASYDITLDNVVRAYDDLDNDDVPDTNEYLVQDDETKYIPPFSASIVKTHATQSITSSQAVVNYYIAFTPTGINMPDAIVQDVLDTDVQPGWVSGVTPSGTITGAGGPGDPVTITWINQNVGDGVTANYSYTVTIPSANYGLYDNLVTAYDDIDNDDIPDVVEELDNDPEQVDLPLINQQFSKVGVLESVDSIQAIIKYTIAFTPSGISYPDAIVQDTLDTLVLPGWVSAVTPSGTVSGAGGVSDPVQITWIDQNVPDGTTAFFTYTLTVPRAFYDTYDNVARVYDDLNDDNIPDLAEELANDNATVPLPNPQPDLIKTATIISQNSQETLVNYTLQFTATGLDYLDLIIQDTIDEKIDPSWVSNLSPANGVVTGAGGLADPVKLTWTNLTVSSGSTITLSYLVTIPSTSPGTYDNIAIAYDDVDNDDIPDAIEEVDRDDAVVTITPGTSGITKTANVVSVSATQAIVNYTISFTAEGISYNDLIIEDTVDSKVLAAWISNISDSGTIAQSTSPVKIRWVDITVNSGQTITRTYTITVPAAYYGTYDNVAIAYDDLNDDNIPTANEEVDRDPETVILIIPNTAILTPGSEEQLLLAGILMIIIGLLVVRLDVISKSRSLLFKNQSIGSGKVISKDNFEKSLEQVFSKKKN